jgi:hypothetical protein
MKNEEENIFTDRAIFFEKAYQYLTESHMEIKFNELTDFEIDRAAKLLNFCNLMAGQFENDERFSDIFEERDKDVDF